MSQPFNLPDALQGLVDLGNRGDLEMRPVLLRVVTDLFVGRESFPREDIRHYEAIALGLIDRTDIQTQEIVAGKLARCGATPASLVTRFLDAGGRMAAEFLAHSSLVPLDRLRAAAAEGTVEQAEAVAGRVDLDEDLARALAARPEIEVARKLADNLTAPLAGDVAARLVARGRKDESLARALCYRLVDADLVAPLFLHASPSQRAAIILSARRADLGNPTRAPRGASEIEIAGEIERAAIAHDRPLLSGLVARALGATLAEANAIIADPRGEPLALALAALRVTPEAAARIFMCLDAPIAHSHGRVRALSELVIDISPGAATSIIAAMIGKARAPRPPTHAPVHDSGASETASRPASNARDVAPPRRRGLFVVRRRA